MYTLFLLPFLIVFLAVVWIAVQLLLWRDRKLLGAALGLVLSSPAVLSLVSHAEVAWLWAREGLGVLIAAYAIQIACALVGAKLQKDHVRRKQAGGRGDKDPAYHYIDK